MRGCLLRECARLGGDWQCLCPLPSHQLGREGLRGEGEGGEG